MNNQINEVLEQIRVRMEEAEDAPAQAAPVALAAAPAADPEDDMIDAYFSSIVDTILQGNEHLDETDAIDVLFSAIDSTVESGILPAVPEEDAEQQDIAAWLEKAKSADLLKIANSYAREKLS